jgi:hypothetical protein
MLLRTLLQRPPMGNIITWINVQIHSVFGQLIQICFLRTICDHHQSEANMRTQQHQPALAPQQILWRGLTKGSTSRCLRKQKAHKLKLGPEQLQKINLLQIYFTVSPGQKINMCSKQLQKFNMATFEKQQKSLEIVRTSKVFERLTHQRRESVQPQQTDKHKR